MAAITTVEVVADWLDRSATDERVIRAFNAAHTYVLDRCTWPDGEPPPDDLVMAVCFQTARVLERRNSPDGTIGVNEFGVVRVGTRDADVADLMGPWRQPVIG